MIIICPIGEGKSFSKNIFSRAAKNRTSFSCKLKSRLKNITFQAHNGAVQWLYSWQTHHPNLSPQDKQIQWILCTQCEDGCWKEGLHRWVLYCSVSRVEWAPVPVLALAQRAGICWKVASWVIDEYHGGIMDCGVESVKWKARPCSTIGLTNEHESFLLWIRFDDPFWTNDDYVKLFLILFDIKLSCLFISWWFQDRFEKRGVKGSTNRFSG